MHRFHTVSRFQSPRSWRRGTSNFVRAVGLLLVTGIAGASPSYPSAIREQFPEMSCTPKCSICHLSNPGLGSNASQPFSRSLLEAGLKAQDVESLVSALATLERDGTDSDKDGVVDVDELRGGSASSGSAGAATSGDVRDPSVPGVGDPCAEEVRYGCGAQVAGSPPSSSTLGVVALGLLAGALVLLRRGRALFQ